MTRVVLVTALLVLCPPMLAAQELPLKRDLPKVSWQGCPPPYRPGSVPEARRLEAERLATAATESSILGDNAAALDLLSRAALRDPGSDRIAYRLARTLETLGRRAEAITEYCRYLALAPEATDAPEARQRLAGLTDPGGFAVPAAAVQAFESALGYHDAGRQADAEAALSAALDVAPTWADAIYDRGVIRLQLGLRETGAEDLRRYIELNPAAPDVAAIVNALDATPAAAAPRGPYNPSSALATGLIVPGLGHFTTGRPLGGLAFLGGAVGLAAAGILNTRIEVECLATPVNGVCPQGQVLREERTRPYLVPAIGAAVAIGVLGAIDAFRGAKQRNEQAAEAGRIGNRDDGGATLGTPTIEVGPEGTRLGLIRILF